MGELRSTGYGYDRNYSEPGLHGEKDINNHMAEILLGILPENATLLDVGCGDAQKLIPIAHAGIRIIGIDISQELLSNAAENIRISGLTIEIVNGDMDNLPIGNSSVDCISYMLAPHNADEAFRALKPGGYVVRERVGFGDKPNIKGPFKKPDGTPRGYQSDFESEEELKDKLTEDFARAGFVDINFVEIEIITFYTPGGLNALLEGTPTIKDYDKVADKPIVDKIIETQTDSQGKIKTIQRRLILVARKPDE